MKLEDRIARSITQRKGVVVLRSDFDSLGASDSQVSRVINKLIQRGKIQRVSRGAFVKTKINKFTGTLTPAAPLEVVAKELFTKLNIQVSPPSEVIAYNAGLTTQIPAGGAVVVKGRKISRKISVAGRAIRYA